MYKYRVQFKGYYSEDDMWLPTSYFSRAVNYESVSTFGQKRKHNIDPGAPRKKQEKKRRVAPLQEKEMKNKNTEQKVILPKVQNKGTSEKIGSEQNQ